MSNYDVISSSDIAEDKGYDVISPADLGNKPTVENKPSGLLATADQQTRLDNLAQTGFGNQGGDTRAFQQYDPSNSIAQKQLEPVAEITRHPVGAAISGAMGVAKGATLGLIDKQVEEATAAMPSLGLQPSGLAEGAGQFAGILAPWEGIGAAVSSTFGLANAGRAGRIATQIATGGIVGATEASNTGKDIVDQGLATGAFAGAITGGVELPSMVRDATWFRKLTIPERDLVVQTIGDIRNGLAKNGWDQGRIDAKIARLDPETFQAELKKRMGTEGIQPSAPADVVPAPTVNDSLTVQPEPLTEKVNETPTTEVEIPHTGIADPTVTVDGAIAAANADVTAATAPVDRITALRAKLEAMRTQPAVPVAPSVPETGITTAQSVDDSIQAANNEVAEYPELPGQAPNSYTSDLPKAPNQKATPTYRGQVGEVPYPERTNNAQAMIDESRIANVPGPSPVELATPAEAAPPPSLPGDVTTDEYGKEVMQRPGDVVTLYHGGSSDNHNAIMQEGIKPNKRYGLGLAEAEQANLLGQSDASARGAKDNITYRVEIPKNEIARIEKDHASNDHPEWRMYNADVKSGNIKPEWITGYKIGHGEWTNALPAVQNKNEVDGNNVAVPGVPDAGAVKQPWEMDHNEFGKQKDNNPHWDEVITSGDGEYLRRTQSTHKAIVKQALSEGKPVPPEVLADYPDLAKSAQPDKRTDVATRKKVSEMTHEEKDRELLTNHVTGIPNKRAYEEADRLGYHAAVDADSLKWVNDNMSHDSGTELLKNIARAIADETDRGYHISGDEYIVEGKDENEVNDIMARVNKRLAGAELVYTTPDGTVYRWKGLEATHGTGTTLAEADAALNKRKSEREASGERAARGEKPSGVVIEPSSGRNAESNLAAEEVAHGDGLQGGGASVTPATSGPSAEYTPIIPQGYTAASNTDLFKRLRDGEPVDVQEVKDSFKALQENKPAIIAELSTLKKDDLLKKLGQMDAYRYKNDKKDIVVKAVYNSMVDRFAFIGSDGTLSYGMGNKNEVISARVEKLTQEDLVKYAEESAAQKSEMMKRYEGYAKSLKNPETWEEFQNFIRMNKEKGGIDALTPEQRVRYDELHAEHNKEAAVKDMERKATVGPVSIGEETTFNMVEGTHGKTGEPLFIVQLGGPKLEGDVFKDMAQKARQLGGNYVNAMQARMWKTTPGFQFKTKENANKFMSLRDGSVSNLDRVEAKQEARKENAATRLTDLADSMEEKANGVLNADRLTNTAKRAGQAESSDATARKTIALAKTIRNIAEAIQEGEAKHLEGISAGTHVETLESILQTAKYTNLRKNGKDGWSVTEERHRPADMSDIEHVEYPYPEPHRDHLRDVVAALLKTKGGMRDGQWLSKKAAETGGTEYSVEFKNPADIERLETALAKVKFSAKSAVENTDERMIKYKRLQKMGLVDLPTLRAGLREFLQFKDEGPKADRAKALERALVGGKHGIDFFPTPPEVAADLVERAGIKPGMKVLEPGGGTGNIADEMKAAGADVDVAEISDPLREVLEAKGHNLVARDFMDYEPGPTYDAIVMNPPFSADIEHVQHAFDLLKPGGKLVAIVGEGSFGGQKKQTEFKQWLEDNGASEEKLPAGTFQDKTQLRTTGANARVVEMVKGGSESIPEETLVDMGLLYDDPRSGKWKYKFSHEGNFFTANSKEDAVERATAAYNKMKPEERLTKEQRGAAVDKELFERLDSRYGKMSVPELEAEYERLGGEIKGLQNDREFTDGGRRTSAAVGNEGARQVGQEKLELGIYLKQRIADSASVNDKTNLTPAEVIKEAETVPEAAVDIPYGPKDYTMAAQRPGMTKDGLKTVADVVQAFKDGKLEYNGNRGATKYADLPDKEKADASLETIPKDAKITVVKDKVTITVKGEPLTDEQKAENKAKAQELTDSAESMKEQAAELEKLDDAAIQEKYPSQKGFDPGTTKHRDEADGRRQYEVNRLRKAVDDNKIQATELLTAKSKDTKHVFYFEGDRLQAGKDAGGDLMSYKRASVEGARAKMKLLAGMDKNFKENPVFTIKETDNGVRLVYKNGSHVMELKPSAFNIDTAGTTMMTPSGHMIGRGDTIRLSPGYLENKTDEVYLIPKGGEGATFYQNPMLNPAEIVRSMSGLAKNLSEDVPKLVDLGKQAFQEGAESYRDWSGKMKDWLGDLWNNFKANMSEIYFKVKNILKDERGEVGSDLAAAQTEKYNSYLDKADAAIDAGKYEEADKWIAKAQELSDRLAPQVINVTEPPKARTLDELDPEKRYTSTKNAVVEEENGPQERFPFTRQGLVDMGKALVDNDPLYDVRQKAIDIVNDPSGPVSIEDYSALFYDRMRIENEYKAVQQLRKDALASGDKYALQDLQLHIARLEDATRANSQATTHVGTWMFSAVGHLRQAYMDEDYSAVWLKTRAETISGDEKLPESVRKQLDDMAEQLEASQKELQEAIKARIEAEAQKAVQRIATEEITTPASKRHAKRAVQRGDYKREFAELGSRLRSVLSPYKLNFGFDPEAVAILADMARLRIADGITKAADIVEDIYKELHDEYAIEKRDIQDAISEYGKEPRRPNYDELESAYRKVKSELKLFSALEDAEAGLIPLKSGGVEYQKKADEIRILTKQVHQAMKQSGIDSTISPDDLHWRTAEDAAITRLTNDIADLDRQIDTGKRDPVIKSGIKYGPKALELKEIRNAKQEILDAMDAKPGISAQRRVEIALNALEKSIENYTRKIETKDFSATEKPGQVDTPAVAAKRAVRNELKKTYDQMRKDALPPKEPKTQEEKDVILRKAYVTRLLKKEAEYKAMKASGDFTQKPRRKLPLFAAEEAIKARVAKEKEEVEMLMRRLQKQNRSTFEKTVDMIGKVQRGVILSGTSIIWKIGSGSVIGRPLQTLMEEAAGTVLRLIPPMRLIMDSAPREGNGLSVRAEAAAFVQWFKKEQYQNLWDRMKQGKDSIQLTYHKGSGEYELQSWGPKGAYEQHAEYILDAPGRMHGALKSIAYTQEYHRALQYRTEYAIRNGWDLLDEKIQTLIHVGAEGDANRIQFMGDNFVNSMYRQVTGQLRRKGPAGFMAAAALKANLPIVKVPTNYVGELLSFIPPIGAAKSLAMVAQGYARAGKPEKASEYLGWTMYEEAVKNMTEEEAEYATRAMKKQVVGMGLLLASIIGGSWFLDHFGRFYKKGEKRKVGDLKPGEVEIDGVKFSDKLFHMPIFDSIQSYAMVYHIMKEMEKHDEKKAKKDKEFEPSNTSKKMVSGMMAAGVGMAEKVPFISTPLAAYNAAQSYDQAGDYLFRLGKSYVLPGDISKWAKSQDSAGEVVVPRKGGITADIPYLRQNLPIDMDKVKRMPLDALAEIMENANSDVKTQLRGEFRKKFFLHANKLDPEDRSRYGRILRDLNH